VVQDALALYAEARNHIALAMASVTGGALVAFSPHIKEGAAVWNSTSFERSAVVRDGAGGTLRHTCALSAERCLVSHAEDDARSAGRDARPGADDAAHCACAHRGADGVRW
jgi:hypothetical protein